MTLDPKALEAVARSLARSTWGAEDNWRHFETIARDALAALPQAEPVAAGPVAFVTPETMKDILAQSLWTQGAVGEFRCDNRHGFTVPLYAEPPFASPTPAVSREVTEQMLDRALIAQHDNNPDWKKRYDATAIRMRTEDMTRALIAALSSEPHHG